MQGKASVAVDQNRLLIKGDLNFATAAMLWESCLPVLKNSPNWIVDFSGVVSANSASLAFLIELVKYAKLHHKEIQFHQVPLQMSSLAAVAGMRFL